MTESPNLNPDLTLGAWEVHGPYSSEEMMAWPDEGLFEEPYTDPYMRIRV